MDPNKISQIKACRGVYTLRDTARHFNVSTGTVHNIWHEKRHRSVCTAAEPPNVISRRVPAAVVIEDGRTLLERGMRVSEAAEHIGVTPRTLRDYMKEEAPVLLVLSNQ